MTTPTLDMRGGNGPTRVIAIDRMSSLRIASAIAWTAGLKRSTWPIIKVTPARRAAVEQFLDGAHRRASQRGADESGLLAVGIAHAGKAYARHFRENPRMVRT